MTLSRQSPAGIHGAGVYGRKGPSQTNPLSPHGVPIPTPSIQDRGDLVVHAAGDRATTIPYMQWAKLSLEGTPKTEGTRSGVSATEDCVKTIFHPEWPFLSLCNLTKPRALGREAAKVVYPKISCPPPAALPKRGPITTNGNPVYLPFRDCVETIVCLV